MQIQFTIRKVHSWIDYRKINLATDAKVTPVIIIAVIIECLFSLDISLFIMISFIFL
jgi:hypothetical protein